jgi:hypothetical protein
MKHKNNRTYSSHISRRDFLKLAAATGLLAGCGAVEQSTTPPTDEPTATPTPTQIAVARRPDIIKMYPDIPSKVVHTHHAGVWDGDKLLPEAIRQMLDASITKLTGLNDAREAWMALFDPGERIAIKVNTIRSSQHWTHVPLVMTVTECLQEAGVPAEQIIIFDRDTYELENAGYLINKDGPGVRCRGTQDLPTDDTYIAGWTLGDEAIGFSDILLNCDALINMPILKQHSLSGISFAMKNHYGTFDRPSFFHGSSIKDAIPELNALQPIKERTRLNIGDALSIVKSGWYSAYPGDSIFMSFDSVAHDTAGLQLYKEVMASKTGRPAKAGTLPWLENGAKLGLGTNDPAHIELVEVTL